MALAVLRVRTAHLPDMDIGLDPGAEAEPVSWIWRFLRPSVKVDTALGSYIKAPWGDPGESSWPLGAALLVIVLGAIGLGLLALGKRIL